MDLKAVSVARISCALACVASVSVRFGSKELQGEIGSLPIFRAGKTPKIPFFAPKPHGNACYAGYLRLVTFAYRRTGGA